MELRQVAEQILQEAIRAALPDAAVRRALEGRRFPGRVFLLAVGKAAWQMAATASALLGEAVAEGMVITKYGHVRGALPGLRLFEAGHPVPDENSVAATEAALAMTAGLCAEDTVLLLLSGGGSALFEKPLISLAELQCATDALLRSGADIVEMNTVRKRLSAVKGGRFAAHCLPARVLVVALSDVLGDPPDMIASGPACADPSSCAEARQIVARYALRLSKEARTCLTVETPKSAENVETVICGSVRQLCRAAAESCRKLGFRPIVLTDRLCCNADDAGRFFASIAQTHDASAEPLAFIAGGETVVTVRGSGRGGRNQELALAAAAGLAGLANAGLFSIGSDGTDGPTDAAGGYVDGDTARLLAQRGISLRAALDNNDAYPALDACGGLIRTGPTGTNVNDLTVLLIGGAGK